jgi:8-oxo-dGTP diphosphatase
VVSYVPCAGAIVFDLRRRLLVIRRGRAPSAGTWSIPGGRCEPGETPADACTREVREETGVTVAVLRWAGRVERPAPDGRIYLIDDFVCELIDDGTRGSGGLRAGDDAEAARWVNLAEFDALPLAPGLREALFDWDLLPA